ncbi:hypothetical protein [Streptomyces sp. NPDC047525]|uniref:hypothetical protein n=1 Tax=Streptomyces sp. NPDC047525 TaxID=3155264 RepID=UPI0033C84447
MARDQRPPHEEDAHPFRARGFIASAIVVGLVAVLGGVVLVTGDSQDTDDNAAPTPTASKTTAPAPDTGGSNDGCPAMSSSPSKVPAVAPEGVTWELIEGFAVPESKTSGPAKIEGDVARCYAHTPTGALTAAVQITVRNLTADDWKSIAEKQAVGDGRQNYIDKRAKFEKEEGDTPADPSRSNAQISGFKFVTYSAETAVIDLVWQAKGGQLSAGTVTMKWHGGDWKNEIALNPAPGGPIDDMSGYAAWGGV